MGKFVFVSLTSVVYILQSCLINGQGFTSCTYDNCTGITNLGVIDLNTVPSSKPFTTKHLDDGFFWKACQDFTIAGVTAGNFTFTSQVCCPSGHNPESVSGISPGTVIVIIFFAVLVGYIVFGTVFQVSVRKAQGRERIPNVALWSALPGFVRDGFIFTFTCGRRSGYAKI